jgi:hypothetical protein
MCHVREGEQLEQEVASTLRPEELAALMKATHRPLYCCQVLTSLLRQAQLGARTTGKSGLEHGAGPQDYIPAMASFRMDEGVGTFTVRKPLTRLCLAFMCCAGPCCAVL